MTREGQGIDPEETTFRPASTRWSEPETAHDDGFLPPFVPGRAKAARQGPDVTPDEDAAPAAHAAEESRAPDIQPFEPVEIDAATASRDSDEGEEEPFPFEMSWEEESDVDGPEVDLAELEAQLETATPAGPGAPGGYEDTPSGEGYPISPQGPGTDAAAELAGRFDELARRLRAEGADSVTADMASPDRFTALLAGLVAGYLAGREG
jgi:hypothetical protein